MITNKGIKKIYEILLINSNNLWKLMDEKGYEMTDKIPVFAEQDNKLLQISKISKIIMDATTSRLDSLIEDEKTKGLLNNNLKKWAVEGNVFASDAKPNTINSIFSELFTNINYLRLELALVSLYRAK